MISWRSNTQSHLKSPNNLWALLLLWWLSANWSSPEGWSMVNPGAGLWKNTGQGSACSDMADMVLIKWPYVSPLYFTKPGVHWEYATLAGESAQAFVYFTEAGRRAWRTAQHADHRLWRNIYLFRPGGGPIPGGDLVPPRVVRRARFSLCVRVGIVKQ